jgi:hypothetical protein
MKRNHTSPPRQRFTAQQRSQLLNEFEDRTGTASEFAARHGIGTSTLFNWLRQSRQAPVGPSVQAGPPQSPFQQVSLAEVLGGGDHWTGEVRLPDGTQLRWSFQTTPALLHELLAHLRQSC